MDIPPLKGNYDSALYYMKFHFLKGKFPFSLKVLL